MNTKLLLIGLMVLPMGAYAAIPYRTEQVYSTTDASGAPTNDTFAHAHRIYAGAMYDFSIWSDDATDTMNINGKNTSSFEGVLGVRVNDTFRIEGNYIRTRGKWDAFSFSGNTAFVNAIVDARIDALYRLFYAQKLVPYVGAGAGLSWNSASDVHIDNKISPALAAMAGIGVELGEYFALDFGYRYMYMFKPKFDIAPDMAPREHQFRIGARVNIW